MCRYTIPELLFVPEFQYRHLSIYTISIYPIPFLSLYILVSLLRSVSVLGAATEMSLLTGPSEITGGCQSALVDKLGVSPSLYHHSWSTSQITCGWTKVPYRPQFWDVSLAPIIANLPINTGTSKFPFRALLLTVTKYKCGCSLTRLNVVFKWLTLLRIREFSRLSLGPATGYHDFTGRKRFDRRQRRKDSSSSFCVQTGSGVHPASCPVGTGGLFQEGTERTRRDADHAPHLVPRSWMSRSYISSKRPVMCSGTALLYFTYTALWLEYLYFVCNKRFILLAKSVMRCFWGESLEENIYRACSKQG
jgi:hypothetical protein